MHLPRIKQTIRRHLLLIAAINTLLLTQTTSAAGLVDDFENPDNLGTWCFYNGSEYPGARGAIISTTSLGTRCAELQYDFTPITGNTGAFDPHYVMVTRAVTDTQSSSSTGVSFALQASNWSLRVYIRVTDASGQTLQFASANRFPLSAQTTQGWMDAGCSFARPLVFWSGANDGVVHQPIKKLSIILDATGQRNTGYIRFDNIKFIATPPTQSVLQLASGSLQPAPQDLGALTDKTGVNVHFTNDTKALDVIKAAKMRWIRMDSCWSAVEQTPGSYNFTAFDNLVNAAESRGLGVLAILDYGNPLYTGDVMNPPRGSQQIAAYAAFCEAFARHYTNRNVLFEIWNEPDVAGFWGGKTNSTEYAAVLRAGIDAVLRGNSKARVITGGLSCPYEVTYSYWDTLSGLGAMNGAGGWGAHLYVDGPPEVRWTDILKLKDRAAMVMPNQTLWCSEWGYSSTKLSSSQNGRDANARTLQASRVARQMLVSWWANLPMVIIYDIRDDGTDPANIEHNFGLLAYDYTDKPAMAAARTLLDFSSGRKLTGLVQGSTDPEGSHVLRLNGPKDHLYVAWSDESTPSFDVKVSHPYAQFWDMLGRSITPTPSGTGLTVTVSAATGPVYIQVLYDTTPPLIPINLTGVAASASSISLTWSPSTDVPSNGAPALGLAGYKVYRNGVLIATLKTPSFTDTGLAPNTCYTYSVSAYDMGNNNSQPSTGVVVKTLAQ